ncbi:ThiF family adenylyltransferase [Methylobacterium sp. 275MFSha3.1]|uniref:ThiF family adenylyltransferase n=1 Tax=Methylobacterium sp. 275MFSha3.1 TaxID=1502746 RepID=UPI000B868057|nr:ThiF family adenylyltransferase [Methylobacterium sp. 275MFSha3.1]
MADRPSAARLAVHDALRQRGFERVAPVSGAPHYAGTLDRDGLRIPVTIEVSDLDFVRYPRICIQAGFAMPDRTLPHLLGVDRSVCYYGKGSVVLDRYKPGSTVLQCLEQAETVLRNAIRGRSDGDFADEFQAYWSSIFVYVDLPEGYSGPARVRPAKLDRGDVNALVVTTGRSWFAAEPRGRRRDEEDDTPVDVVSIDHPLTFASTEAWPPTTVADINRWLEKAAPDLVGRLETVLQTRLGTSATVLVRAPNGLYCYQVDVPQHLRKPEFLKSRRHRLPETMARQPVSPPIERSIGVRADADYMFGRNLGRTKSLVDKRILLIGCGTIGSFLAHQLAQCGAGAKHGYLSLVDPDVLTTGNIGRHLLGVPYLGRNKAEACASYLIEQLPLLAIEGYDGDVREQKLSWDRYDLVIDATGEEALSIALNEIAVQARPRLPPHLFVWLLGNGAVAQCILTGEADRACFKCLKPDLAGQPRFRAMRPETVVETVTNVACGDAAYVPFPVSRSVAAAALACDLVIDWANGNPGHRFRSLTLDHHRAFQVQDGSPTKIEFCPACGGRE